MSILEVKNISYKYGKYDCVIRDLSLSFEQGNMYAILGSSGAGKTTLLSLLAGLDNCSEGSIYYKSADLKEINRDHYRAKNIGMVFQQFNLLHRFNALENILVAMEISKYKVADNKEYAKCLLDDFGIDKTKQFRKTIELSGGEQQRVAIARAISHSPDIILADEPTGNLDEENKNLIMSCLVKIAKEHSKCVILTTHSKEVAAYADEVIKIKNS